MSVFSFVKWRLKERRFKKEWRERNPLNSTELISWIPFEMVSVGRGTYGSIDIITDNYSSRVSIGNYCSLAKDVKFIAGAEHRLNCLSTFPFKTKILGLTDQEGLSKGDIVIDDDVWIGYGATILSGVHVGQGAVIATGAVVTKDIPPYAIAAGIPAGVIRFRFRDEIIEYLKDLDFSKLEEEQVRTHISDFYNDIEEMNPEELKKKYDWFPRKGK